MSVFNKDKGGGRKRPTTGFSELNRRTYEASSSTRIPRTYSAVPGSQNYSSNIPQGQGSAYRNVNLGSMPSQRPSAEIPSASGQSASDYARSSAIGKYSKARRKSAKRKGLKTTLIIIGSILAALIAAGAAWAAIINANMNVGDIGLTPTSLDKPFYMVLMGVDSSEQRKAGGGDDNNFRSDSIILARIDAPEKKVTLMSMHRDVEVDMGGEYGTQKLNAAHSIGGPELVCKTVSQLAGVDVNHYAEINFDGFKAAVDDLGGVEVNVPMAINDAEAGGAVDAGQQNLNGEQALILCRARHPYDNYGDGDKYRAAMQRMVLSAIATKTLHSDILTIAQTVTDMSKYIKTDLSLNDMIGLAQLMKDIDPDTDVYTAMMPTAGVYKDGVWYEEINQEKWKKMMKRMDEGLPPLEETIIDDATGAVLSTSGKSSDEPNFSGSVAVRNGTTTEGVAANASSKISSLGFETNVGNANTLDYTSTVIVFENESQRATAQAIRDALGCGNLVKNNNEYNFTTDYLVVIGTDYQS